MHERGGGENRFRHVVTRGRHIPALLVKGEVCSPPPPLGHHQLKSQAVEDSSLLGKYRREEWVQAESHPKMEKVLGPG